MSVPPGFSLHSFPPLRDRLAPSAVPYQRLSHGGLPSHADMFSLVVDLEGSKLAPVVPQIRTAKIWFG